MKQKVLVRPSVFAFFNRGIVFVVGMIYEFERINRIEGGIAKPHTIRPFLVRVRNRFEDFNNRKSA
jgi:hypothetical protein